MEGTGSVGSTSLVELMNHRERRSYDYRIKAHVIATGNPNLFPELQIPRSTASSWIHRGLSDVVVLDDNIRTDALPRERVARLEGRVSMLSAVLRLVLVLLRLSGFRLGLDRVPKSEEKRRILAAIGRARKVMPLASALRVLGLSATRYRDWTRRLSATTAPPP